MDLESIIKKIIEDNSISDYNSFFELISKSKLYFYVIDDGSFSSIDEIVISGKDRPITIPTIQDKDTISSVLYISEELALKNLQKGFRIAKTIKGIEAIKFQYDAKGVNEIVVQGNSGYICIDEQRIKKIINSSV